MLCPLGETNGHFCFSGQLLYQEGAGSSLDLDFRISNSDSSRLKGNPMYKRTRFYRRRIEIVDGAERCYITVSLSDGSKHEFEVDSDVDGVLVELQRQYWNLSSLIKRHEPTSEKLDTYYQTRREAACTDPAELLIKKVTQDKARTDLAGALAQLPVVQSRRFLLKYGLEMTYREIALEEGCSVVAVKKSVRMAKAKLRSLLEAKVTPTS